MNDWRIIGIIVAVIMAIAGWVAKHITNSKKHPCKDDIVFQDVCDERSKRLDDCIETSIEHQKEQYQLLREDVNSRFDRIEDLIKNGG
jgi:hypothetical protein